MGSKILIIDDEEVIRFAFKTHLSKEEYEVLTAEDYSSALEIISNTDLDVIIADIILGGHTGIDILREVKDLNMNCPVIMITGEPNVETAADAVRLGAFDYLPKPVRKDMLLRVTNHALNHKALMDEKEKYRQNLEAIFGSLNDAIITVDQEMHVLEANEATKHICGLFPRKIIGKEFGEVQTQCTKPCLKVLRETLKTKKIVKEYRVECRHQDRSHQVVLLSSSPLTSPGNRFRGAILVARDITRLTDLERELKERHRFHNIIGKSRKMQEIYRLLEDLADTDTTLLITGESGTGKEMVARALHYESPRAANRLVNVSCSALTENLLESELFGHVKGAFTGSVSDKIGRFQMADGGTIFLDEIGSITPMIQLKLLRVLQEKEFERVGESDPIKVNVRIIAATNRNLRKKVSLGEFREDLYYRLKVVEIKLPPLREREEDIPLLVDHFCENLNKKINKNIDGISDEALILFMRYPWPGNVRELEHALEHAFILCHGSTITIDHLPPEISEDSKIKAHSPDERSVDEQQKILQALNNTDWNKAKAARLLGVSRRTIYRKIDNLKLSKPTE